MDESIKDTTRPVVVFRSSGDAEAGVVRALLESYGIPCNLSSDITHIAYPLTVDGLGEVRVSVPASLAKRRGGSSWQHERAAASRSSETGGEDAAGEGESGGEAEDETGDETAGPRKESRR